MNVHEGIRIDPSTGKVIIDLNTDRGAMIPTVAIKPFMRKFSSTYGLNYYIAYKYINNVTTTTKNQIDAALKDMRVNQVDLGQLVYNSMEKFKSFTPLYKIDTCVVPNSSSKLLTFILRMLKNHLRKDCVFITDDFVKMKWGRITLAQDKLDNESPELRAEILKNLEKTTSKDDWKMKGIYQRNKKFIDQFLEIINDTTVQNIVGKNVLIVDDIKTEGTTIIAMNKLISPLAKSSIGYIFLSKK